MTATRHDRRGRLAGWPARVSRFVPALAVVLASMMSSSLQAQDSGPGGLAEPLTAVPGDAARGRQLVANRSLSLCLLCHKGPVPEVAFQGDLAPDLAGAGARNTAAQLRQRLVDSRTINPASIMPAYHVAQGFNRVASNWQGKTILGAQDIEDLIAYLMTLK